MPNLAVTVVANNDNSLEIAMLPPAEADQLRNYAIMEQTATTLRNRVNELGVAEAVIQRRYESYSCRIAGFKIQHVLKIF